jgi:sulfur-oxidizing protein SoxZ
MARALVNVPAKAKRGDIIEIKALISHPMESGFRVGANGKIIQRDIIQTFTCTYNGEEVFKARYSPAIAANPFISFSTRATDSGEIVLTWRGDNGFEAVETKQIAVE